MSDSASHSQTPSQSLTTEEQDAYSTMLQKPRSMLVSNILGHPQLMPSVAEFEFMNPSLSEDSIRYHLSKLQDEGIVLKQKLPPEQRTSNFPHTFYELSEHGWAVVEKSGWIDDISTFRDSYHVVLKPDRLLDIEEHPRPDSAVQTPDWIQ